MAYSITTTYLLWFFFGWTGIHHLYLGRLNHAIVWFVTLGGGGGIGWLRDMWRIPSYVAQATADDEYRINYLNRKESRRYPPCSHFKSIGMFVMGYLAAVVFSGVITQLSSDGRRSSPDDYIKICLYSNVFYYVGAVTGIHLVANIGETRLRFQGIDTLKGCFLSIPLAILSGSLEWAVLFGGLSARFCGLKWKPLPRADNNERVAQKKFKNNCIKYLVACLTWKYLICYGMYSNASVAVQVWPWPQAKILSTPSHEEMENIKHLNLIPRLHYYLNISTVGSNGTSSKILCLTYYERTFLPFDIPISYNVVNVSVKESKSSTDLETVANKKPEVNLPHLNIAPYK